MFERDRQLLEFLHGIGIRPGAELRVKARNYDETLSLEIGGNAVQLGKAAANKVWAEPVED